MSDRHSIISYWLKPSQDDAARFQSIIDKLAANQGASRFEAHLSLGSFIDTEPNIDEVLSVLKDVTLTPQSIETTPSFTMSLYVQFAVSDQLAEARRLMEELPGFTSSRTFDPHISLCYGAPVELDPLMSEVRALLSKPVHFDGLAAVDISVPVKTHDHVASWRQRVSFAI